MSRGKGEVALAHVAALARSRGTSTQGLIVSWIGERFLHRLARSAHAERLVLKGGHLFGVWEGDNRRATADVDLGHDRDLEPAGLSAMLRDVAVQELDDGVLFDADGILVEAAFVGLPRGARAAIPVTVAHTRLRLKVDVTYGQPVVPGPELRWHRGMDPDASPVRLACAPRETMVAEKLAITVEFGADNTRTRDYHDLWHLSRTRCFGGGTMQEAVRRSFAGRPAGGSLCREGGYWSGGFRPGFATRERRRSWRAFCEEHSRGPMPEFDEILGEVAAFALPLLHSVRDERRLGRWSTAERRWQAAKDVREGVRG